MPLTSGELDRIRAELGYNVLNVGAEPFIGVHAVFSQVIQPYLREGNDTTSSTVVTASEAGAYVAITVASSTGISLHERVGVDVDDYFEMATVRSVAGSVVGLILKKAHPGTYPVTVDGGLMQVRECLAALYDTHQKIKDLEGTGSLKAVDEIQFYEAKGKTHLAILNEQLDHWRNELRARLGIPRQEIQLGSGGAAPSTDLPVSPAFHPIGWASA